MRKKHFRRKMDMILIIGGSGFIGYHLHQSLIKSEQKVISTYNTNKIEEKNFVHLDVNNKNSLRRIIKKLKLMWCPNHYHYAYIHKT